MRYGLETTALVSGASFGAGLAASGMTDPGKVLAFLDLFGAWDPSLMFVMGGAVLVTVVTFRFVLARATPVFAQRFHLPTRTHIDTPLLVGAAIFGIGWGLIGYCPGPAIAALAYLDPRIPVLLLAIGAGAVLGRMVTRRL